VSPAAQTAAVDPAAPFEDCPAEIVAAMGGVVPTVQQWEAISHPLHSFAIVAGAGSGKTSLMAARIAYLSLVKLGRVQADHQGALPSEVLGLTFTNKAAEHLARKTRVAVEGLDLDETEEPTVLTYHAFGALLLQTYALRLGLEPGANLLAEAQKWDLVAQVMESRTFDELEVRHPPYVTGQILQLADQCANLLVSPDDVARASRDFLDAMEGVKLNRDLQNAMARARQRVELAGAVAEYRERKRIHHRVDYGDQIELAVRLAEEFPEVGAELRDRYRAVLLDEYQDTNEAQARLMRALFPPPFPVTAVGDPDQNIYAWRGASLRNLLEFGSEFAAPGEAEAPHRPLYVNFRSGSRILSVANQVIQSVPQERRAKDKRLIPHPSRGEGRVLAFVARDQTAEADQIARLIGEQVAGGRSYGQIAVLCRKKRLFRTIDERLRAADIPTEVVDVGGLLRAPEIVDLVAYLRVIADPSRNVSLARLLLGPRWRIGYRDLARLSAWSAEHNYQFRLAVAEEDDPSPGETAFALVEALDHLDEVTDLSTEARERLQEFTEELASLRARAALPPAELCFAIAEATGLLAELDASPRKAAVGIRQNVLAFLDHLAAFAPLAGEATLQAVLDYLDRAEEAEEELEAVQPSGADTVKLMTIHKAKGLEWDVVFVPGMAEGGEWGRSSIFPDTGRDENPLTSAASVPYTLRREFEGFPDPREGVKAWRDELKLRAEEAERRNCYVALTRARELLVVSSGQWYEGSDGNLEQPLGPGRFYLEIAACEETEVLFQDKLTEEEALPENNPLIPIRQARAARWPIEARPQAADGVFASGWRSAAEGVGDDPDLPERLAAGLDPGERSEYDRRRAAAVERIAALGERDPSTESRARPLPSGLSVSGLETYARCPKRFYWSAVRPLPRRPSAAAALGTSIHRWIEQESRGQGRLLDLDAHPDLSPADDAGPGQEARLKDVWRASRYAGEIPLFTERPFELFVDGTLVRGRIDAVYGAFDGPWEIVDFKTGRVPEGTDRGSGLQLAIYALAAMEIWKKTPEELKLTYYYLSSDAEVTVPTPTADEVRARVREYVTGIGARDFEPTPGPHCRSCDFTAFCDPGRAWLAANGDS
jgi:DNA helicase-2/ATP-dependent DNA helicase PcrA